jgi:hypothetical protein
MSSIRQNLYRFSLDRTVPVSAKWPISMGVELKSVRQIENRFKPIVACLLAEQTLRLREPVSPAKEAAFTVASPWVANMAGNSGFRHKKMPYTLASMTL